MKYAYDTLYIGATEVTIDISSYGFTSAPSIIATAQGLATTQVSVGAVTSTSFKLRCTTYNVNVSWIAVGT